MVWFKASADSSTEHNLNMAPSRLSTFSHQYICAHLEKGSTLDYINSKFFLIFLEKSTSKIAATECLFVSVRGRSNEYLILSSAVSTIYSVQIKCKSPENIPVIFLDSNLATFKTSTKGSKLNTKIQMRNRHVVSTCTILSRHFEVTYLTVIRICTYALEEF